MGPDPSRSQWPSLPYCQQRSSPRSPITSIPNLDHFQSATEAATMSSAPRRTASTSSRPSRPAPQSELPHRTRSVAVRSFNSSQPPSQTQYAHSKTPSHDHRPPANYAALDSIARQDAEAKSRRDRDVSAERPATARTESTRRHHHRTSSMQPREAEPMSGDTAQVPASGTHGQSNATTQPRRRTTITTPTGNWALGKTIGAGSMGKVKLAKNIETGEQVTISLSFSFLLLFFHASDRLLQFVDAIEYHATC